MKERQGVGDCPTPGKRKKQKGEGEHRRTKVTGDLSVSLDRKWSRGVARRRN